MKDNKHWTKERLLRILLSALLAAIIMTYFLNGGSLIP